MIQDLRGIAYTLSQGLRVSRFLGQSILSNFAMGRKASPEQAKELPSRKLVMKELVQLFERDLANIRAGLYKLPSDLIEDPIRVSKNTLRFFWDLPWVRDREMRREVKEFSEEVPESEFPSYYVQNFHYQTDGYLSERSAELYDHQVETVFAGGADAMRRQALVPLHHFLETNGQRDKVQLLDVACGTGRFLRFVKENHPKLMVTGLDLSPWYLKKATESLNEFQHASFVEANAEDMPFRNEQFDVVSCVFLFHELPRLVRAHVAAEMARVLKLGGILIFVDSLQLGDKPELDGSLKYFPTHYYEPYYSDYIEQDLDALFGSVGLVREKTDLAFFSKILTLRKVRALPAPFTDIEEATMVEGGGVAELRIDEATLEAKPAPKKTARAKKTTPSKSLNKKSRKKTKS
jgi:ubiquinone/menaquinone biosynthesis C-methylase UbiE